MAEYRLVIKQKAAKELEKLPDKILGSLYEKIKMLPNEPYPRYSRKLSGGKTAYRLKDGKYRIIYLIEENVICIVSIGHRKDIYKRGGFI